MIVRGDRCDTGEGEGGTAVVAEMDKEGVEERTVGDSNDGEYCWNCVGFVFAVAIAVVGGLEEAVHFL